MSKITVVVVEDELIVAKDIQNNLIKLGYDVPATASNAAGAMEKINEIKPDLVFLDIKLKGDIDGIQIAAMIKETYNIPVIFLTSYVDKATLDRAKVTEPYGYIVKPFNESELQSTVEMALYKFKKDQETKDNKERFESALSSVDEGIIICDTGCEVNYLNQKAENLLGYGSESASGKNVFNLLGIADESGKNMNLDYVKLMLQDQKTLELNNAQINFTRDGKKMIGDITLSEVQDEKEQRIGYGIIIREPGQAIPESAESSLENMVVQNSFFVKKGSMLVKVFLKNISYIQAMDNYVIIQTGTDQFVVHSTMKDIDQKLPSEKFLRVHRSYIIPIEKVNVLDENTVLIGEKTIPVGKSYKEAFMKRLNFL
jgi:PAS domain S-box-containing protein